jgi:FkbM family methyltransferase
MNLIDSQVNFKKGIISKRSYIEKMYELHLCLFDHANFIKNGDIEIIEIKKECLVYHLKNGMKLQSDYPDKGTAPFAILSFSAYETEEIEMIFKLIGPHDVCFDIGANIGFHAINFAKLSEFITIYAFEPIPKTFSCLKKNISLNSVENVSVFNFGFSNEKKYVNFHFDSSYSGAASLRNLLESENNQIVVANVVRLDDFFSDKKLTRLDFIKCDVEGAEFFVLQGGLQTLRKCKPIIYLEMLRKWSKMFDYHPNDIIDFLKKIGYRCFTVKNKKLIEFFYMDENTLETNFFFLHSITHRLKIESWLG